MSGLLFRASKSEKMLRSVGDPPNGVVGVHTSSDKGCYITVSAAAELIMPGGGAVAGIGSREARDAREARLKPTIISFEDAFAACADLEAAGALWSLYHGAVHRAIDLAFSTGDGFEPIVDLLGDAMALAEAMALRFGRGGPDDAAS